MLVLHEEGSDLVRINEVVQNLKDAQIRQVAVNRWRRYQRLRWERRLDDRGELLPRHTVVDDRGQNDQKSGKGRVDEQRHLWIYSVSEMWNRFNLLYLDNRESKIIKFSIFYLTRKFISLY